jgi:hypothetical protein
MFGSVCELETQTLLSDDLYDVNQEKLKILKDDTAEAVRMLKKLEKRRKTNT